MSDLPPEDGGDDAPEDEAPVVLPEEVLGGSVQEIEIQEEMERSFLEYAMSVIVRRALPDARDGLKPVHRRILYGMHDMGARPDRPRMKSARITGEVMGKFHPHGEGAIYDALVRMAQPFSLRDPLIDFHGNYGSPDFGPAASRYCVTGDTMVRLADGTSRPIAELVDLSANSERDIDVDVLDKDGKPVHASRAFNSGVHPTKRITTKSGFTVRGTHNHPVLCLVPVAGVPMFQWLQLDEVTEGTVVCIVDDDLAAPRPAQPVLDADNRAMRGKARQEPASERRTTPYVAEFVRSELVAAGRDVSWLVQHNFDRVERWETERLRIIDRIKDPEILATILPIMDSGYRFEPAVSVVDEAPAEVYSIRVDSDDHSFLAGGFVNHNTESRLATLATEMLAGIDEDTVDFASNYTNEFEEPAVLPSRFPNLLVNGSQGIAVGMATNIPPHNLVEVVDATVHLIDNPDATPEDLMAFVKGPDFPTGGLILGRQGILDAYRTGRGSIRMRARAELEETRTGYQIVVSELPYQVSMSGLLTRMGELVDNGELTGIDTNHVADLSAGDDTRLVIPLKRDANANVVLNNLFKLTSLQTSFGVNMVALVDGVPRTLNLVQALQAYVEHQVDVITRRSEYRLRKAQEELHIKEGLLKALDMIDAIIALVRGSADRAEARGGLMVEPFEFSEIQANHILDMTIGRLTRLGRSELETQVAELKRLISELEGILGDPAVLRTVIKTELGDIKERFGTPRRAIVTHDPGDMNVEDLIDDEPLVFLMTRAGYVKTVAAGAFRTQGRGGRGIAGAKLKEEDLISQVIHTTAHAFLLFFSNRGRVYRLRAHEVPMKDRTAKGTPVVNLLSLEPDEKIQAIIATRDYPEDKLLLFATRKGIVKKTPFSEYDKSRREGFIAITLKDGDELVRVLPTSGTDDIFMVTRAGTTNRFSEESIRPTGRSAQGVIGIRLRAEDEVVSCDVARDEVAILMVTDAGFGKRTQLDKFARKGRGTIGVRGIRLTAKRGFVVEAFMVGLDDEIMLAATNGVTARMPVRNISSQGRDATGVRIMNLDAGSSVATAAPILSAEEPEE